jgi:hypothetical protein
MTSINKQAKVHKSTTEVKVEFSGKNLTPYGGLGLFNKFSRKLGVERVLDKIRINASCEGGYQAGRKMMSLIYGLVCGLERPADTAILKRDKAFQTIIGYEDYYSQSAFSRLLGCFSVAGAEAIGAENSRLLVKVRQDFKNQAKLTLDMDSHVKTVYGNQQRANVGYNPKKPGRKSYHPLFCFIGETRDFLLGKFRPGNKYTSHGAVKLLKECLQLIPQSVQQLYLRADSGFYSFDFLSFLNQRDIRYAVSVKLYGTIQAQLGGLKYRDSGDGVEASEFEYVLRQGEKTLPVRMVVIREEIKEGQKATKKEARLFELKGYSYQVIATNIVKDSPENVWRFYNGRANIENMIKEGAMGFGLEVSPSHRYGGNAAYFQIGMLAYNLLNWFKELALNQQQHKTMIKWIRQHFFCIAGKLVSTGGSLILKLSQNYPWQAEYRKVEARLEALQFI